MYVDDQMITQVDGGQILAWNYLWSYGCTYGTPYQTTNIGDGQAHLAPSEPGFSLGFLPAGPHAIRVGIWDCQNGGQAGQSDVYIVVRSPQRSTMSLPCGQLSTTLTMTQTYFPTNGNWTIVSGSGSLSSSTGVTVIATFPSGPAQTVIVRYNFFVPPCGFDYEEWNITVAAAEPTPARVKGAPSCVAVCDVTDVSIGVTGVTYGTWSLSSGTGGTIVSPNNVTTTVSSIAQGVSVFKFTPCQSTLFESVTVSVGASVDTPISAGSNMTLGCNVQSAILAAPATGGGQWTVDSGPAIISNPCSESSTVKFPPGSTSVLRWSKCPRTRFGQITIASTQSFGVSAGANQFLGCQASAQLNGSPVPPGMVGQWSYVSGYGVFFNPNDPFTSVSGISQNSTFQWTISAPGCATSSAQMTVTVTPRSFCTSSCTLTQVASDNFLSSCDPPVALTVKPVVDTTQPVTLTLQANFTALVVTSSVTLILQAPTINVANTLSVITGSTLQVSTGQVQVGGLVVNQGASMIVDQATVTTISGSADLEGQVTLSEKASLVLNGTVSMTPNTQVVFVPATTSVTRSTPLTFRSSASFAGVLIIRIPQITFPSPSRSSESARGTVQTTSQTYTVAQYSGYSSEFSSVSTQLTYNQSECDTATATPTYTSSSLSVTVTVQRQNGCGQPTSTGLSAGAIVGIVIGCVAFGVLVFILILVIVRKRELVKKQARFRQSTANLGAYNNADM